MMVSFRRGVYFFGLYKHGEVPVFEGVVDHWVCAVLYHIAPLKDGGQADSNPHIVVLIIRLYTT